MNKILETLPNCYRNKGEQQEIADAITRGVDEYLGILDGYLDNFEGDRLDPQTCLESWLDLLAQWAGWGEYWDRGWTISQKRELLSNTDYIWGNRGNKEIMPYLFGVLGLNARLEPETGFILGVSPFPSPMGSDPFSYVLRLTNTYQPGTPEYLLVQRLAQIFLPCWVSLRIVYVSS